MIQKLLIANRGEIAVRACRAAAELRIRSVAIYAPEDRASAHRLKADEAYEVGVPGSPVRAYLDAAAIVALARRVGADAVYPGYGFLSENPALAQACAEAGIAFVGPPAEVLRLAGDKTQARAAAVAAGLPVPAASGLLDEDADVIGTAGRIGFPLFVKAAHGGGGRGMRLVQEPDALVQAVADARREAAAAFGDGAVYLERAIVRPRHVEVQVLADAAGGVVHLHERDCSIQRRHQKVIEIAPAPGLDEATRTRLCDDAVRLARSIGYVNAGTVELLLDPSSGEHVFIEMNPRIQVEHTVTEETTDVDLVRAQLLIAGGATLAELGIGRHVPRRGVALQCRVTTEDPADGFRPDSGRITAYRAPGGAGIRIDEGSAFTGAEVSPYYDPLLVKVTARGTDFAQAAARARRAVEELRIRGVRTNQAFLGALLEDPDFLAGRLDTSFVDERPWLVAARGEGDRASRLLRYLAEVTVNRERSDSPAASPPADKLPPLPGGPAPDGSRQLLAALGPAGFARALRGQVAVALTDTTLRDAHQSLVATRMRTYDMLAAAPHLARSLPQLLSLEAWGGATYDVALRFLHEDPWERLERLREAVPNVCLQMLLRGRNLLAYEPFAPRVVRAFVQEARVAGVDVFRIFDALNDPAGMRSAIDAVLEADGLAEGTLCYTGDLDDPTERVYTLDYYLRLAEQLVEAGVHVLAIKDMAGLLRPAAARRLVAALRERFDAPVHLHTHDTAGGQLATYWAAIEAGVDAVDAAAAPFAGSTSQPSISALVAALQGTERDSGLSLAALLELEPYWEAVRSLYARFETGRRAPTGRVYRHEIPGGQLSNLHQQAEAIGVGDRFEEVERAYERANRLLGGIVKVTPSSKVVGDLALFAVSAGIDFDELAVRPEAFDLPASVLGFLRGELGVPPAGFPQPFTERALAGKPAPERPAEDDAAALEPPGRERRAALDAALFPAAAAEHRRARDAYGDLSLLPTGAFLDGLVPGRELAVDLAPGVRVVYELEAIGDADEHGLRVAMVRVNGQLRVVEALDRSVADEASTTERADPGEAGHVAAPVTGAVTVAVAAGDVVEAGQPVATIEAMKMESTLTAPVAGTVRRIVAANGRRVAQGELVLVIERPALSGRSGG